MTHRASDSDPLDLGTAVAPDPFWIQPGVIVLERFCVIGHVRHTAEIWRVPVTDLHRELGAPPNHRLDLHFLPIPAENRDGVRTVLGGHQLGIRRMEAVVEVERGLVLFVTPADLPPLTHPLRHDDAFTVARVLSATVAWAHRAAVVGIRFDMRDLRIDAFGQLQFASWRHLVPLQTGNVTLDEASGDLRALIDLLSTLGNSALDALLADPPRAVAALAERLATAGLTDTWQPPAAVLPAVGPFVGREAELLAVHKAVARARHDGLEAWFVTGPPGCGRSRFLAELALEFERGKGVLSISATFRSGAPTAGLAILMTKVADAILGLPADEQEECAARMRRSIGAVATLVAAVSPRLGQLIASGPPAPDLALEEGFIRHSATIADLLGAIGTAQRPLILLLDDLDRSDASTRRVLYQLATPGRRHHMVLVLTGDREIASLLPPRATTVALQPLTEPELASLVRAALPGPVDGIEPIVSRLVEVTHGSPTLVWRRLHSWVELGILRRTREGRWTFDARAGAASNVVVLPSRWNTVPVEARAIAVLMAIRADPVTPGWLGNVTSWDTGAIRTAIGVLIECGVVGQDPGGRLAFTDDAARARMTADATVDELRTGHQAIAAWLGSVEGSVSQRAWHLEHATEEGLDDGLAEAHLEAGAEHLAMSNAERAQWHFEHALARADDARLGQLAREGRADSRLMQDDAAGALADYRDAIADVDPMAALVVANRAVYAFFLRGKIDAAIELSAFALARASQPLPTSMASAALHAVRALVAMAFSRRWPDPEVADQLALLHTTLVATVAASHPHVGLSSLFRAMAVSTGLATGPASRGRAFFSTFLGALGLVSMSRRLIDDAEATARAADNPMYLGTVQHFRGQNELAFGNYALGQASFHAAIDTFRSAGDLSVGVITMSMSVFYALDHEPTRVLLDRLDEAEAAAWRQRNTNVLPAIRAMRLWVRTRAGELGPVEVERLADEALGGETDLMGSVVGGSLCSLALTRVGLGSLALARAGTARAALDSAAGRPPFLEVALLAEATALVGGAGTEIPTRGAVRQLRKRAKHIASLRVGAEVCAARLAIREGRVQAARDILAAVIEDLSAHGELWNVLEAHTLAAELHAGRDPVVSQGHAALADDLRRRLGVRRDPAAAATAGEVTSVVEPDERSPAQEVALWQLVDVLRPTIGRVFPPDFPLRMRAAAGVRTVGDRETVELLVVNLVLACRDAVGQDGAIDVDLDEVELDADDAARMGDARPGRWARIRVSTEGTVGPATVGGLRECRALTGELFGFLDVDAQEGPRVELVAHLPAPDGMPRSDQRPLQLLVVVHRDESTRRSLMDAATRLGWTAQSVPPGESLPEECSLVLVEASMRHVVPAHGKRLVAVVRRGQKVEGECLTLPYLVHDLEQILKLPAWGDRAPSGEGSRSG